MCKIKQNVYCSQIKQFSLNKCSSLTEAQAAGF